MQESFDAVHDLIITKPKLYNRIISVDISGYRIVGSPRCIDDKKYARNAFIFNFVFVFTSSTTTTAYEPIITKIGDTFRTCELESSYLSKEGNREKLEEVMAKVFEKLNSHGLCSVNIDDSNCLYLKLSPSLQTPPIVHGHQVPIYICTKEDIATCWDLTIQQILPYINGFNHVAKIACLSEVNISLVKECIQHLVAYGFLKLISIFQYCNVYVAMPEIQCLLTNCQLSRECLQYVNLQGAENYPGINDVFRLYCGLEAGQTVKDMCTINDPRNENVDERLLIQYGLMRGLIRHLQKYPVLVEPDTALPDHIQPYAKYLDGSHCFDEICCETGLSSQALDDVFDSPLIATCWK